MPILTFIAIVAILILIIALNSFVRTNANQHNMEIMHLRTMLNDIKKRINTLDMTAGTSPVEEKKAEPEKPMMAKPVVEEKTYFETIVENYTENEVVVEEVPVQKTVEEKAPIQIPVSRPTYQNVEAPKVRKSFFEKYPDIEKFIGENLINKIGIVILVLGLGFLVKYAIDKNWINEIGRVAIGILSAGALIGLAHKMRKDYKPFSSVLIGGGLALLYFTITLAFHTEGYPLYQQQTAAFILLVFITMFAVFLSITYNRIEIAILAILGGFGSPFMVSNGAGNYIILFSYLMILNIGMLVLSYFKKWRLVNIVAFAFTVLLFAGWLISELVQSRYEAFGGAIVFATGFYIIFFIMNMVYNLKQNIEFKAGEITLILSNTVMYFTFMMLMLTHINDGAFKGLFSVLLGLFNFGFAYFIHSRKKVESNLLFLLIGLVFTFITLAIPLQLQGNYITLFWSVECVLLLWLGQKSGFKIMKMGSLLVLGLMLISLIMDWANNYHIGYLASDGYVKELNLLINKMFITTLIAGGALLAVLKLLKNENETYAWGVSTPVLKYLVLAAVTLVFYVGGFLEVNYQASHFFVERSSQSVAKFTYHALFFVVLLLIAFRRTEKQISILVSIISGLFVLAFFAALSGVFSQNIYVFNQGAENFGGLLLVFRWISIIAVYVISILIFKTVNKANGKLKNTLYKLNSALLVFTLLYLLSADLDAIAMLITKSANVLVHTQKTGYAILWGISSFILMLYGMKRKEQIFRVLSLILFAITIAKLFIYDISNISEGGKILAFILLGVLLLIISFMYQKLKKLIVDEAKNVERSSTILNESDNA